MRNKITETEYKMMESYRNWYAWQDTPSNDCKSIPVRDVLEEWEDAKGDLFQLLGNELIVTKPVSFEKDIHELQDDMCDMFDKYRCRNSETRINRQGWVFIDNLRDWVNKTFPLHYYYIWDEDEVTPQQKAENEINEPIRNGLNSLVNFKTLTRNSYEGDNFTVTLPNGKPYTVRKGCKPLKPLAKIADAFNLEGFEDFRICHSQVLNQKALRGDLSLSIHPLDYWTMSDNDCGWDSCMSWENNGGYRQGTVEMMNSPCVIVAYLNASEPMTIGSRDEWEWSNKKWRCLFIAHKNMIVSVKGYPYKNEDLTKITLNWIKELAEKNMGWTYWQNEPEEFKYGKYFCNPNYIDEDEEGFKISFQTENMYNDIGSTTPFIYLSNDLYRKNVPEYRKGSPTIYYFNFSGASQCMSCGKTNFDLDGESCLVCNDCEQVMRCHECGERIWEDSAYWIGDTRLCECCYDNLTSRCSECEEDFFTDDINAFRIMLPITEEVKEFLDNEHPFYISNLQHSITLAEISMCDNCIREFAKGSLKSGGKVYEFRNEYGGWVYGVYADDIIKEELGCYLPRSIYQPFDEGKTYLEIAQKHCGRWDYTKISDIRESSYFSN